MINSSLYGGGGAGRGAGGAGGYKGAGNNLITNDKKHLVPL